MTVEKNLQIAEATTKALSDHDLDRFLSYHHESAVGRYPSTPEPVRGREAIRPGLERLIRAFPDLRLVQERAFGQGDWVTVQGHFTGTHRAPLEAPGGRTFPATNKAIRLPYALVAKIENGKIAELQAYYDLMGMAAQLGLPPPSPPKRP